MIATWPIGPTELPPEGHVLSGPCPLHTSTTYPGSRPSKLAEAHNIHAHIYTHTHAHKLCTPSAPCYGGGQGLACHPGSGVRGRGGSGREREMGKWSSTNHNRQFSLWKRLQHSSSPSPVTVTVILGHSVFHIYITQHTRCKVYNLLALHLAVFILGFKGLLQSPKPTQCY